MCSHLARPLPVLPHLPTHPHRAHTHTSLSLARRLAAALVRAAQRRGLPRAHGPHGQQGPLPVPEPSLVGLPILGPANQTRCRPSQRPRLPTTVAHPPTPPRGPGCSPRARMGSPRPASVSHIRPTPACPTTPKGGTEPCVDDWAYDPSTTDSIVTEACPRATLLPPPTARNPHLPCSGTGEQARL